MSKEKIEVGDWVRLTGEMWAEEYPDVPEYVQVTEVNGFIYADQVDVVGDTPEFPGNGLFSGSPGDYDCEWVPASEVPAEVRFEGHPSTHVVDTSSTFADLVTQKTTAIADLLVEKNRKYGDSALNPANVFSKANAVEALKVRIDDKINRIQQGESEDTEDSVTDLIGYLILLQIATEGAK